MSGQCRRAFVPIAGLHHAGRDHAAGFCVFNDCGVAIELLRKTSGLERIAYVDIDAHHGDGVFYAFEDDPGVIFADMHEDGRYLYPGTGSRTETGKGAAEGTKLNDPMAPGSDDSAFDEAWPRVIAHVEKFEPEFIILQCGADSLEGDPITHLRYTSGSHGKAARELAQLADRLGHGRVLGLGGWRVQPLESGPGVGRRSWRTCCRSRPDSPASASKTALFAGVPDMALGWPAERAPPFPPNSRMTGSLPMSQGPPIMFAKTMDIASFDPELAKAIAGRTATSGRSRRVDRVRKLRQPPRARGSGLRTD